MERVELLVEDTQARIPCLLNPESIVVRRWAGVRPRGGGGARLAGPEHRDDPLVYVGGGWTEFDIDLLFDVSLSVSAIESGDVREVTRPVRALAENPEDPKPGERPSVVRLLWGKQWNEPGVIVAIAERLEHFSADGRPRRSWVRMRMRRVEERPEPPPEIGPDSMESIEWPDAEQWFDEEDVQVRELPPMVGDTTDEDGNPGSFDRIDQLSTDLYGTPFLWRLIAYFNGLDDPLEMPRDRALQAPPPSAARPGGGTVA